MVINGEYTKSAFNPAVDQYCRISYGELFNSLPKVDRERVKSELEAIVRVNGCESLDSDVLLRELSDSGYHFFNPLGVSVRVVKGIYYVLRKDSTLKVAAVIDPKKLRKKIKVPEDK